MEVVAQLLRHHCSVSASVGPAVRRGVDQAADVVGRIETVRRHQPGGVDERVRTLPATVGISETTLKGDN